MSARSQRSVPAFALLCGVALILSAAVLPTCGRAGAAKPAEVALDEGDAGKTFHVVEGSSFTLALTSNGSIPYNWSEPTVAGDAVVVMGQTTASNGPPVPGNSETTTYRFRAVKPGQATIQGSYTHRTGSEFATEARNFTIIVDKAR